MSNFKLDLRIRNLKSRISFYEYTLEKYKNDDTSLLESYIKSYQEELEELEFIRDTLT